MNSKRLKPALRAVCLMLVVFIFTGLFSGCEFSVSVNTEEAVTTYVKTVTILPEETESPEVTTAAETTAAGETGTAGQTGTTSVDGVTTATPEVTTKSPEVTTKDTEVTTKAAEVTTKAPEVTTKTPEVTTKAPEVTTRTPEITTKTPEVTTKVPEVTTKTPEVTTKAPEVTTKKTEVTTKTPEVTTKTPEVTTKTPEITTKAPEVTTKTPEVTTRTPEVTTKTPEVTTRTPEVTTKTPEVTTKTPEETTKTPEITTQTPEITTGTPEVTTNEPEVTTAPVETRSEPDFDNPLSYSSRNAYNYLDTYENSSAIKNVYNLIASAAVEFTNSNKNCVQTLDYQGYTLSTIIPDSYEDFAVAFEVSFEMIPYEEILTAWAAFRNDNPLYFWYGNTFVYYTVGNTCYLPVLIDINYANATVRNAVTQSIYTEAENVFATVKTLDDYHTALTIHNLICTNIDYKLNSSGTADTSRDSHSVAGYFKREGGVCECYAKTFNLFMNIYGVENMLVINTNHAFNIIKVDDGNWYWVDVTFDDNSSKILTVYFCKNDTEDIWTGSGYQRPKSSSDNTFLGAYGHEILPAGGYDYVYEGNTYMYLGLFYIYELPARSTVQYNPD